MAEDRPRPAPSLSTEELRLARFLAAGTRASLGVLVVAFAAYVFGIVPPRIPIADLRHYWVMDSAAYRRLANLPDGWGWLRFVVYGDFLNVACIATLALLMLIAYGMLLPIFVARRDRIYVVIVAVQILVLLLAASGLVAGHR